jgi:hypothetical protein
MTGEADRDLWVKDRANVMKWWDENREGFIATQEWAASLASELDAIRAREIALAEHECCPTCTRPMEFWPAAMRPRMDEIARSFHRGRRRSRRRPGNRPRPVSAR